MTEDRRYTLAVIKNFVVHEKQNRFIGFIESRRDDLLDELFIDERNLNQETLIKVPSGKSASFVIDEMKKMGATDHVYLMSHHSDLDGKFTSLEDAIESVFGRHFGALLYCVNSGFGYYEDGETSRYILRAISKEQM
ncbi:MAG TPA: hypothetical protein PLN05_17580 [Pyrinomonadaceae bacterium]|nr:hypothetical protein [Chloracidobacterium sp.]HRK52233.1 hypothetical protein [Pyrinomonadaceae bacterium]